jgi:hypothetical protein
MHIAISDLIASLVEAHRFQHPDTRAIRGLWSALVDGIDKCGPVEGVKFFKVWTNIRAAVPLMALILPLLSAQCDFVGEDCQKITVSTVLAFATKSPAAFKRVLVNLELDERRKLETVLRIALEKKQEVKPEEEMKPAISLKLDFASVE